MFLRQSTAGQEVLIGRFVDDTDGNTAETGLTIANTDIKVWKEGATTLADKNSGGATHIASGMYYAVLDATDTNTLGNLELNVQVSGALSVRREFTVIPAAVYDSIVLGSDNLQVDAIQVSGSSTAADNIEVVYDTDFASNYDATNDQWERTPNQVGVFDASSGDPDDTLVLKAGDFFMVSVAGTWNSTALEVGDLVVAKTASADGATFGDWALVLGQDYPSNFSSLAITAGGIVSANSVEISGSSTAADNAESCFDGTTYTFDALGSTLGADHATTQADIAALNDLDAAGVRSAVGLASADLDTQIGTLATSSALTTVDGVVDAIKLKTDNLLEKGTSYRYTNDSSGSGYDDVTVDDVP
jgi:hypothetical protein